MNAWEKIATLPKPLAGHVGVPYNRRVYGIGGISGAQATAWVGATADGTHFEVIAPNPTGLTPREGHAACVFNERIWVSGGLNIQSGLLNDVLSSEDGREWQRYLITAIAGIAMHQMVAFENERVRLVILGGVDNLNFSANNKVHISVDGEKWAEVKTPGTMWSPRYGHTCLVYDNRLWVIGGFDVNDNPLADVWYTENLNQWVCANKNAAFGPRGLHASCVSDCRMWVIGGYGSQKPELTTVYFSRDGVNWKKSFDLPVGIAGTVALETDRKICVFGGINNLNGVYRLNIG